MDMHTQMIENQIKGRGVRDPKVIRALQKVKRHYFVPPQFQSKAYEDTPLPIGHGQTISQPYIVACMSEILDLSSKDRVLEIGTGSGYQAAVLAEICEQVYSIEVVESLALQAKERLARLGYLNIKTKHGDGYQGWEAHAPYDAIIVTCSPSHVPQVLETQLREGGRMVIPVGNAKEQDLYLLKKEKGVVRQKNIFPVRFVPMTQSNGEKY